MAETTAEPSSDMAEAPAAEPAYMAEPTTAEPATDMAKSAAAEPTTDMAEPAAAEPATDMAKSAAAKPATDMTAAKTTARSGHGRTAGGERHGGNRRKYHLTHCTFSVVTDARQPNRTNIMQSR
jgi:hypothetical protein